MGQPITNYDFLKFLNYGTQKKKWGNEHIDDYYKQRYQNVIDSLSQFRLFAFIIHDSQKHKAFDRYLNSEFHLLDFTTHDHLLFFAFVNPPESWVLKANDREYYKHIKNLYEFEGLSLKNPIRTQDSGEITSILASLFNIPLESLPALVITNDLSNKEFFWVQTNIYDIAHQLNQLGMFADNYPDVKNNWEIAEMVLKDELPNPLNINNITPVELSNTIARTLYDVLNIYLISHKEYDQIGLGYNELRENVNDSIIELQDHINSLKSSYIDEDNFDWKLFDDLNVLLVKYISSLNTKNAYSDKDFLKINKEYLETKSYDMLMTSKTVINMLDHQAKEMNSEQKFEFNIDYSSVGICMSKFFENEINLSIVHWIRKILGIDLPRYYERFQPSKDVIYRGQGMDRSVDFNSGSQRNFKWYPPALGQSHTAFKAILNDPYYKGRFEYINESSINQFLNDWNSLKEIRNRCAHAESIDKQTLNDLIKILNSLNKQRIFKTTYEMKKQLRS